MQALGASSSRLSEHTHPTAAVQTLSFPSALLLLLLPAQRQLAVAAGGDGTLRVLDVLRSDPLLLLEPAGGGLLAAAWSPSRPLVFAAASGAHSDAASVLRPAGSSLPERSSIVLLKSGVPA